MKDVLPIARRSVASAQRAGATGPIAIRIAIASVIGLAIIFILLLRLWALTVLNGQTYVKRAEQNVIRRLPVEAPRGAILDRNGRQLVTNRAAREIVLNVQDVAPQRRPSLYRQLADTLGVPVTEIRQKVERGFLDPLTPVVIARDVTDNDILFYLEEHASDFPGVDVRNRFVRNYIFHSAAAHIFGQIGEVNPSQLKDDFANLEPGDRVGQSGLERTYDEFLRGTDGYRAVQVDAAGVRQKDGRGLPALPGRNLQLTIDLGLQRATERAIIDGLSIAHRTGARSADAGAAVAIDPRSGEVLSMASFPTYDPNIFVTPNHDDQINRVLNDSRSPMSDRATEGLYPPGSTYKVVTGIGAMEEGFVSPDQLLDCRPYLQLGATRFKNWTPKNLGAIDMSTALEVSCDTYFYQLGLDFFNAEGSKLRDWSEKLGLGRTTGIDLPGEQVGVIPTPAWRKRTFSDPVAKLWKTGDSVNLSIGQGDLLVTPLQMTRLYAAIADDGTIRQPHLARSVQDPSGREVLALQPDKPHRLDINPDHMRAVRDGLYRATHSSVGTASAVFSTFEVDVSGKTGTAEKGGTDMAWFCAYAPSSNPTIAACAIIEKGGHGGTSAAPVVLKMFQQWFQAEGGSDAGQVSD